MDSSQSTSHGPKMSMGQKFRLMKLGPFLFGALLHLLLFDEINGTGWLVAGWLAGWLVGWLVGLVLSRG